MSIEFHIKYPRDLGNTEECRAAYEGGIGADRMAMGLKCIPDPLRGDMDAVLRLRKALEKARLAAIRCTNPVCCDSSTNYPAELVDELTKALQNI